MVDSDEGVYNCTLHIVRQLYPALIVPKDVCVLGLLLVIGSIYVTNDKGKDMALGRRKKGFKKLYSELSLVNKDIF